MATVGEMKVQVHVDTKTIQQLGWAVRAVELAQNPPQTHRAVAELMDMSFSNERERAALLDLAACCLARLWEIR